MTNNDFMDFADLEDLTEDGKIADKHKAKGPSKGPDAKDQTFPCQACDGTGLYRGRRVHQEKAHCFACRGRGSFQTSERDRQKARIKARERKAAKAQEILEEIEETSEGLLAFLREAAGKSEFAASLVAQVEKGKPLSDRQLGAAERMREKWMAARAERAKARETEKVSIDLTPIREMFEAATENGYKRPTYRAEGLIINRAPSHGKNPGALYVKNEAKDYGGKILGTDFSPSREGKERDFAWYEVEGERVERTAAEALAVIAESPLDAALRYGQRTGTCGLLRPDPHEPREHRRRHRPDMPEQVEPLTVELHIAETRPMPAPLKGGHFFSADLPFFS